MKKILKFGVSFNFKLSPYQNPAPVPWSGVYFIVVPILLSKERLHKSTVLCMFAIRQAPHPLRSFCAVMTQS